MSGTVKVTDVALQASKSVQNVLGSALPDAIKQLTQHCTDLSNPVHWDGKSAIDFRTNVWPRIQGDIAKIESSLVDLQATVEKILVNITMAGGNAV